MMKSKDRKEQSKFQNLLLEQSLCANFIIDEKTNFTYINERYLQMWGYNQKEEILGQPLQNHYHDKNIIKLFTKTLTDKKEILLELKAKRKNNTSFNTLISVKSLNENNKRFHICSAIKLNEKNSLSQRCKIVFDNVEEGIVITNEQGYITEVNKAFINITGYSYDEAIGNKSSILKSGQHTNKFYQELWSSILHNNKWSGKITNKKKNGDIYTSYLTISTIKDKKGNTQNYIGIFTDISDILQYEKKLREKEILLIQNSKMAAMGEMIDNVAHQWKQPLNSIALSNNLLKFNLESEGFLTPSERKDAIKSIDDGINYLSTTIDDFRDFFNPDKQHKEFLLSNCINRALILVKSKLRNQNITIIKNIEDSYFTGIENEFVQVLINLIHNAIDALYSLDKHEKYIFIDSHKKNDQIILIIKDNAGGIPYKIKDKIFESRFTTKEKDKGTGLGLYMSKNILDAYKGTLTAYNSSYNYNNEKYTGAKFIIKVPLF